MKQKLAGWSRETRGVGTRSLTKGFGFADTFKTSKWIFNDDKVQKNIKVYEPATRRVEMFQVWICASTDLEIITSG